VTGNDKVRNEYIGVDPIVDKTFGGGGKYERKRNVEKRWCEGGWCA